MGVELITKKSKTKPIPLVITIGISLDEFADAVAEKFGCTISKEKESLILYFERNLKAYKIIKNGNGIGVVAYGRNAAEKIIEEFGCKSLLEKDYEPQ
ncbi:hypothetical protein HYU07_06505 [Candidatus Woesearchaeota archaeon]|nr:hypothetical protein [Candidatus Woesearchaeota archaeon]